MLTAVECWGSGRKKCVPSNFGAQVLKQCTVVDCGGSGRNNAVLPSCLETPGDKLCIVAKFAEPGAKMLHRRKIVRPGALNCIVVVEFGSSGRPNAVLSSSLRARSPTLLYCRHVCGPGALTC